MSKIIGLYFSPRKIGNCFITLKQIEESLNEKIEIININEKDIRECKACYSCLTGNCKIEDEFNSIITKIIESRLIIIVVPVYILGPNSVFKKFVDRMICLYPIIEKIYNKDLIIISIAGVKNIGEGYTDLAIRASFEVLGFNIKISKILYGALPGEVLLDEENLKKLKEIVSSIKDNKNEQNNICHYCSSRYFEITDGRLKCLICKSEYEIEEKKLKCVKKSEVFFGSLEKLKEHREWLTSMKERYIKERERLKDVIKKYIITNKK